MKSISLAISILVAVFSIILFREQVAFFATYSLETLSSYTKDSPSSTPNSAVAHEPGQEPQGTTTTDALVPPLSNMSTVPRAIRKVFLAIEQAEGAGARVRRSIGTPQLRNFSPFLMLDHFSIKPGAGFPDHPHRGQETITYLLTGGVDHEDFAGHAGTIEAGDLQFMTAGKGM
jgi:quercetin 2,3-dioxygenase